jgi:hypothetical protein
MISTGPKIHQNRRRSMKEMTPSERAHFDAQAEHEAWSFAVEVLEPWLVATRLIGSAELTLVMEKALADAQAEVSRTLDVLEGFQAPALRVVE